MGYHFGTRVPDGFHTLNGNAAGATEASSPDILQRPKKGSLRTHSSVRPNNLPAGGTSPGRPPACRGTVRVWSCVRSKRLWQ
jgi:hypothetical protein